MAHGLSRMVRMFHLYAIRYQPYAKHVRLASEVFLSSLQAKSSDGLNDLNVWNGLNCFTVWFKAFKLFKTFNPLTASQRLKT